MNTRPRSLDLLFLCVASLVVGVNRSSNLIPSALGLARRATSHFSMFLDTNPSFSTLSYSLAGCIRSSCCWQCGFLPCEGFMCVRDWLLRETHSRSVVEMCFHCVELELVRSNIRTTGVSCESTVLEGVWMGKCRHCDFMLVCQIYLKMFWSLGPWLKQIEALHLSWAFPLNYTHANDFKQKY